MDGENQQLLSSNSSHHSDTHNYSAVRQWSLLISLLLLQFLTISIDTFILPFFTEKAQDKGVGEVQIGVIYSAYNLSRLLGATTFVDFIASRSPRVVCLTGGLLTSLACTAFGFAALAPDGAWFFCLCLLLRLVAGIGSGMLTTTCTSVLLKSTFFTPSTIMAAMESMVGVGWVAGPVIGSFLYKWIGYTASFLPPGALTLLSSFVAFGLVPKISKEENPVTATTKHGYVQLMCIPGIMLMFLSVTAINIATHGYAIFLSKFMIEKLSYWLASWHVAGVFASVLFVWLTKMHGLFSVDISIVGFLYAAGAFFYTISTLLSARLVNKIGATWSQMIASWTIITVTFLLLSPSPLLHFIFRGKRYLLLTVTSYIVAAFVQGGIYVPPLEISLNIASLNGYVRDDRRTYTMVSGMVHGGISLGAAISPLLAGLVTQLINYDWFVTMSAFISLFMLLLTVIYLVTMRLLGKPLK